MDVIHIKHRLWIVQTGGSIRDKEVIKAANEHNMVMFFSGIPSLNYIR